MPVKTQIDRDAGTILGFLASRPRDELVSASEIAKEANLTAERVNHAVGLLIDLGHAEWVQTMGTAPVGLGEVYVTSRGRYENQRRVAAAAEKGRGQQQPKPSAINVSSTWEKPTLPPAPVGSPYGFTDEDWEVVSRRKARVDRVYVVLGHQFSSECYDSTKLRHKVVEVFERAVQRYNRNRRTTTPAKLKFEVLAAGYGEHLFNQIARGIIGADIAVFETSDLNPNVMLEMGVALTWGVRVLPIKVEGKPKPPSDLSGQTWADYRDSGTEFVDPEHEEKLTDMIERALRKKVPPAV